MKLVLAVVQDADVARVTECLTSRGLTVTRLASTGGFVRAGSTTLLLGVDDERVWEVRRILEREGRRRTRTLAPPPMLDTQGGEGSLPGGGEVEVGGAVVFVLPIESFERV
ncbi:cyclic-di-AMP receptor [Deinococcus pimensis]|uniref:cyclic-di-AMP receptor n=1 Tax=Deinococcus pimensis TaxID=309888 RepID=UPI0004890D3F|nr:cyclic-di-AMP receptor [Deinococcus pimensis]